MTLAGRLLQTSLTHCLSQPHKMLQANKVLMLARSNKKKLSKQPDESLKGVFGQHDLLSIGHYVDLELTLPFLLGPVPWSLSTPDRISTKNSK